MSTDYEEHLANLDYFQFTDFAAVFKELLAEREAIKADLYAQLQASRDNKNWFDALKTDYDALLIERDALKAEVRAQHAAYNSMLDKAAELERKLYAMNKEPPE